MVYLIDTKNGNEQIVSANSDIAAHYSDAWFDKVVHSWQMFSEEPQEDKIVVMTYAKFGVLAEKHPDFGYHFDYVICDEIHNLPKFMTFGGADGENKNWYEWAMERIMELVDLSGTSVLALLPHQVKLKNIWFAPSNTSQWMMMCSSWKLRKQ